MPLKPGPDPGERDAILRGVYEDNLRTTRGKYRGFRPKRAPKTTDRAGWSLLSSTLSVAVALFILLAAALAASDHETTSAATATAATDTTSRTTLPQHLAVAQISPALSKSGAPSVAAPTSPPLFEVTGTPSVADLYGLHQETIVIDAGHGGRDPGTVGQHGLQEKEITLDVALRLKKRLERYPGYRILLTRDLDNTKMLRDRIDFANENGADLFVSIHVNWLPVDSIAPIETYYYGLDSDPRAVRLAQRENQNSGYSVAEFNDLTQQLRLDLKIQESRDAAHAIQTGLIDGLRAMGRDVNDWGAKPGDFMVLLGVEAPSILAEIGSLSNSDEESQLNTVSYREKLAYILEKGIANYLDQPPHERESFKHGSEEENQGI